MDENYLDGLISNVQQNVQQNNSWSAEQAEKQMQFQEYMSSTAHQREVYDLKAAGLNPILSAGGSGASSATGAMANPDQSGTSAIASIIGSLVSSQAAMANAVTAANASQTVANIAAWSAGNVAQINTGSQQYMQQQEFDYKESHPDSIAGIVSGLLNATAKGLGYNSTSDMAASAAKAYYSKSTSPSTSSNSSSGSKIKSLWNTLKSVFK